jgi:hypothetical protein
MHDARRHRLGGVIALVVALAAGGLLILLPRPGPAPASPLVVGTATATPPVALATVWPSARTATDDGRLDDGTRFTPRAYIDLDTAVGTAPTADGSAIRILLRRASGVTELRRVARNVTPEIGGFAVSGDTLVWGELTYPPGVDQLTQLWRLDWRSNDPPVLLTSDGGYAVFYQTQFDVEIVADVVYWVANDFAGLAATQVRSIPLTGGSVTVLRKELGTYALSAWPWMVTPYSGRLDPARMVNIETGQQILVPHEPGELVRCTPTWCRAGITGNVKLVRIDLERPDGSDRRRIAGSEATPILNDVALLDRFEVLVTDGDATPGPGRPPGQRIVLYDIKSQQTVLLDTGVSAAATNGGLLWWSTGEEGSASWTVLDLRDLAA